MFGLMVVVGTAARRFGGQDFAAAWSVGSKCEVVSPRPDIRIARFVPADFSGTYGFAWSGDRHAFVCVDGYLYNNTAPREASRVDQVKAFADTCGRDGYEAGIRSIAGGTFNLVVADLARSRCHVTTDHIGALALYHSPVEGGWLLSSNPVALARSGLVDLRPDLTAMAEWAYIGYTIGDRFLLKGIKIVPPYTSFHWESDKAEGRFEENPGSPWHILPDGAGPSPEELADAMQESCRRIEILDPGPVNLLSAGKDSRFILAAWPKGYDPPCYTYGDSDSHEVEIARSIAALRGSGWSHVWLDGDDVAPHLEEVFANTGQIVFPDRLLAARRLKEDGFAGVLDGYLGGIFQGGSYLDCDRYFSLITRLGRFLTVFLDQKVSGIGRDRIAEAILDSILEVRDDSALLDYVGRDFVACLRAERAAILDDLRGQVDRFTPASDSLAVLWNNLVLANRGAHAIVQQMAIMRSFVDVYCPFSGDLEYLRLQWKIPPGRSAYKRLYIEMYRRRFPDFGKIRYGASLLPLTYPPFLHKWSAILMSKGVSLPLLTGNPEGRERDANSWNKWLRQSPLMRETALEFLREGGILDEANGRRTFDAVRTGSRRGSGKVFHLAGIAKWLALSGETVA